MYFSTSIFGWPGALANQSSASVTSVPVSADLPVTVAVFWCSSSGRMPETLAVQSILAPTASSPILSPATLVSLPSASLTVHDRSVTLPEPSLTSSTSLTSLSGTLPLFVMV